MTEFTKSFHFLSPCCAHCLVCCLSYCLRLYALLFTSKAYREYLVCWVVFSCFAEFLWLFSCSLAFNFSCVST